MSERKKIHATKLIGKYIQGSEKQKHVRIEWEKKIHATKLTGQYIQGFEKQKHVRIEWEKQVRIEWEKKNSCHKTYRTIYTRFEKTETSENWVRKKMKEFD